MEKSGGLYKATTDENKIREWWTLWPNAMIGLRTGSIPGFWATDPDAPEEEDDPDGVLNWIELQEIHGEIPPTRIHKTPGGGFHYLFKWRDDKPITLKEGELAGLGINVRGEGGYIVAPGSVTAKNGVYEVHDPSDIAEAPDWLYDLILDKKVEEPVEVRTAVMSPEARHHYGEAALRGEVAKVSAAAKTTRNITLNRAAFSLGQLVAIGVLTDHEVTNGLYAASVANGYVKDDGPGAARQTIRSGLKAGLLYPRVIAERDEEDHGDTEPAQVPKPFAPLGEWDAGLDKTIPSPRGWLLGNVFCRKFASSLFADGAVGKTTVRLAQFLSLTTGRSLTGEHVFKRSRALIISLEDGADELRRRLLAAMLHHDIERKELVGWLYLAAPGLEDGERLLEVDGKGRLITGKLAERIEEAIVRLKIDIIGLDPLVKLHSVGENDNTAMDKVAAILTGLAIKYNIAVDVPHHNSKGPADPGNAKRGRGASATKDAFRLVYTLTPMAKEEAEGFGLCEAERVPLIRMDSGKVNTVPGSADATWFKLVGVNIGNGNDEYPNGDNIQTVERWSPPATFAEISVAEINDILNEIEKGLPDGNRYSDHHLATTRAAWRVVTKHSKKTEGQAKAIIQTWVKSGLLFNDECENPTTRKTVQGLQVDNSKRPE
jgi:hypothetical protein